MELPVKPAESERPPAPSAQSWTYADVGLVLAFAVAAQILVYLSGLIVMLVIEQSRGRTFSYKEAMSSVAFLLSAQMAWWALVAWLVYRVVRARDERPFGQAIGWVRPAWPLSAYVLGGALLAFSVAALAWVIPMPRQKLPIEELFRDPVSAFLLAGFGVLVAPAIEELLFRGFLYPVMARVHGAPVGVAATACLFSLVHAQQYGWAWQNLLLLLYVGAVFGALRAVSGSLVPSTLVHASYNLTLFAGLYAATDRFRNFPHG